MAMPGLPMNKTQKSTGHTLSWAPAKSAPSSSRRGLRGSSSILPPPTPAPTKLLPEPPQLPSINAVSAAGKAPRKTVNISLFPYPPRGDNRFSSRPHNPLVNEKTRAQKSKKPKELSNLHFSPSTPSLLFVSGEDKAISNQRMSGGLINISSPQQNRRALVQDCYSTSATTHDEFVDGEALFSNSASDNRSSKSDGRGNVIVSVRVRPDSNAGQSNPEGEWMVDERKSLIVYNGKEGGEYIYDNVFTTHDNNARVYNHIARRLVRRVMEGYHGTVFAYGMSGTGKTFSMQGTDASPGIIPLAINDIFSYIRESPSQEFLLRVSYLEIYNERIHDLLSMPSGSSVAKALQQSEIKLREDSKRGVYATPLKEEIVQSPTQMLQVIARGHQARCTASTQFNARSSRSHAVVQIVVESRERIPGCDTGGTDGKHSAVLPSGVRLSTLSLIDLAGSEKTAESKERRHEGAYINKSLLTLGTVISKLSERKDIESKGGDKTNKHLPYRDSKLTRLLQGALSGNSLVSILCTVQIGAAGSAAAVDTQTTETLNTLKFATRAKNGIASHARRAEKAVRAGGGGGARVLLERYRMELSELRKQLDVQKNKKGGKNSEADRDKEKDKKAKKYKANEAVERHKEQMRETQLAKTAFKERTGHLISSKSIGADSNGPSSSLGQYARFSHLFLTRTPVEFSVPSESIVVGVDHSVAAALKEKDAQIADLRARLDDKDRMLAAMWGAARSRDKAHASAATHPAKTMPNIPAPKQTHRRWIMGTDEMKTMLEEVIQDSVETVHVIRGS
ncbi:kinesin-II [Pochonia chlamydosporia 170]|uniref:Kinesin-like protein n=1 Tax=Pochonia chlamydosporia 170 TaxID=1380566 RepID=A0A179F128_METCM|nr:kinesin-II [Pochonia chlamydosporia 170]OAQ59102.1 kinesin-II [Pochonia chlamydosporia 170]